MYGHSSTVTSSGIFVCGGTSSGNDRKDCYEYRSSSNSWTSMPSMTTKRHSFDMIYLKGKVYAVGGLEGSGSKNSMEIFDSTTMSWTKQSIPLSVYGHCITQLSANQFILIGGFSRTVSKHVLTKNISIKQYHLLHFTTQKISLTSYIFCILGS